MKHEIRVTGKIKFDPKDVTTKHKAQASWKKMAYVEIDGDLTYLYAWFIERRYNLWLNPPLRGAHITFINDGRRDFETTDHWDKVKAKYNGKKVTLYLELNPKGNGKHWWLPVSEEHRGELHQIREELTLSSRPKFGLHLTIGFANEKNIEHSRYIHDLLVRGLIKT